MAKYIICLIIYFNILCQNYDSAINILGKAILETSWGKSTQKGLEIRSKKILNKHLGISDEELIYASFLIPVIEGKINTKHLKGFKTKYGIWNIRPDIIYYINQNRIDTFINFNCKF